MREYKFRAWESSKAIMHHRVTFHGNLEDDVNPWIFMQWTGLWDKVGNEIFEGDVVAWDFENRSQGEVCWEGYGFYVRHKHGPMYFNHPESFEVIGNKFEHPHLLTQPPTNKE